MYQNNNYLDQLTERYSQLQVCISDVKEAYELLKNTFENEGKLLTMGNGGSSADAEHLAAELTKSVHLQRELNDKDKEKFSGIEDDLLPTVLQAGLPAISLGVAHSSVSAFINDVHSEYVFAQQVWVHGNEEDVAFGISTSGRSKNVVVGLKTAKAKGLNTIALTGKKESPCSQVADVDIRVPETETYKIQELHLPIYHALCFQLERDFFDPEEGIYYN